MLEAQQQRVKQDPHFKQMGIGAADGGPARMLRVIQKRIEAEQNANAQSNTAAVAAGAIENSHA